MFGNDTINGNNRQLFIKNALTRPNDFGYFGNNDRLFKTWSLGPVIENRDSGLLTQSNAVAIKAALEKFPEYSDKWELVNCSHWAVGWVNHLSFEVYDDSGNESPILDVLIDIHNQLCDYPVLDEDDYSQRESEATIENIKDACQYWRYNDLNNDDLSLPENYEYTLDSWFAEHDYSAIENTDDRGGYPSDEQLYNAFVALGWLSPEDIS